MHRSHTPEANNVLVDILSGSVDRYAHASQNAPGLLRQLLDGGDWLDFTTKLGTRVRPASWDEFVTTPPLRGLGATHAVLERLCQDEPDLIARMRALRGL